MLGRYSEDEIWSRLEENLWYDLKVALVIWALPTGPLCLWQCFHPGFSVWTHYMIKERKKKLCAHSQGTNTIQFSVHFTVYVYYICLLSIYGCRGEVPMSANTGCHVRGLLSALWSFGTAALNAQTRLEIMTTLITKHNDKYFGKFVLKIIKTSNPDWITTFSVENNWKS